MYSVSFSVFSRAFLAAGPRYINPMPVECWSSVADVGPALKQHQVYASCLLLYIFCPGSVSPHYSSSLSLSILAPAGPVAKWLRGDGSIFFPAWTYIPPPHYNQYLSSSTRHSAGVDLMMGRRCRLWANIKTALAQCILFAGKHHRPRTLLLSL